MEGSICLKIIKGIIASIMVLANIVPKTAPTTNAKIIAKIAITLLTQNRVRQEHSVELPFIHLFSNILPHP